MKVARLFFLGGVQLDIPCIYYSCMMTKYWDFVNLYTM